MYECPICQTPQESEHVCHECQQAEADSLSEALAMADDEREAYHVLESHTLAWDAR